MRSEPQASRTPDPIQPKAIDGIASTGEIKLRFAIPQFITTLRPRIGNPDRARL